MRTLVPLAMALMLMAGKCSDGKAGAASGSATALVGTKWVLETLGGTPIDKDLGERTPYLQLADEQQVTGKGGCNQFFGSFTLEGGSLKFGQMGATKMYCQETMELEDKFTSALHATDSYKLEGGALRLMGGGSELAVLRAR